MKKIILALVCFGSLGYAQVELAVVAGSPDPNLSFIKDVLKERNTLVDSSGSIVSTYTNAIFYFAQKNSIQSVVSAEIISSTGSVSTSYLVQGVQLAALKSAIALLPIGPPNNVLCRIYAAYPDTVFLAGIGSSGMKFNDDDMPSCHSANILFVAGLNDTLTNLNPNQSWGELVRLAVPYVSLSNNPIDPKIAVAFGMGVAAGKMSSILRKNPELRGALLIEKFLSESTVHLPALEGKVTGARALVQFEK